MLINVQIFTSATFIMIPPHGLYIISNSLCFKFLSMKIESFRNKFKLTSLFNASYQTKFLQLNDAHYMNLRNIQHLHDLILDDPRNKLSLKRLRVYNSLKEVEFESPVLVVITKVLQVVFPALLSRQARNTPS